MRLIGGLLALLLTTGFVHTYKTFGTWTQLHILDAIENLEISKGKVLLVGDQTLVFPAMNLMHVTIQRYQQITEKNAYDLIVAHHPYVSQLRCLKDALKPGGKCVIVCYPLYSNHWNYVYQIWGPKGLALNANISDYCDEAERLGFFIEYTNESKTVAQYHDENELLLDVRKYPTLWGVGLLETLNLQNFAKYAPRKGPLASSTITFRLWMSELTLTKPNEQDALLRSESQHE